MKYTGWKLKVGDVIKEINLVNDNVFTHEVLEAYDDKVVIKTFIEGWSRGSCTTNSYEDIKRWVEMDSIRWEFISAREHFEEGLFEI